MNLLENLKDKLNDCSKINLKPNLYDVLKTKINNSTPEYIIQNIKTDYDILKEKLKNNTII